MNVFYKNPRDCLTKHKIQIITETHREHFAGLAMQSIVSLGCSRSISESEARQIARDAAMIAEILCVELGSRHVEFE